MLFIRSSASCSMKTICPSVKPCRAKTYIFEQNLHGYLTQWTFVIGRFSRLVRKVACCYFAHDLKHKSSEHVAVKHHGLIRRGG